MTKQSVRILLIAALLMGSPSLVAQQSNQQQDGEDGETLPPLGAAAAEALNEAIELMNAGDYEEAKRVASDLDQRRLSPYEIGRVEQILATIAFEQEDYATARVHYQKAIESMGLAPLEISELKFRIAQLYFADELYEEAVTALEEWFTLVENPNSTAYYYLAVAYYQIANIDKALENARIAVELTNEPRREWLSLLIALLIDKQEYPEAKEQLYRILALAPDQVDYWKQLSMVHGLMDEQMEALATMEIPYVAGMLEQETDIRRYADLLLYNGVGHRCARALEKGMADGIVQANLANYTKTADCWLHSGELASAAEVFAKSAPLAETGKDYVRLGEVQLRLERYTDAARSFQMAMDRGGLDDLDRVELLMGVSIFYTDEPCGARVWLDRARSSQQHRGSAQGYIDTLTQVKGCE
jgi:tetratricopeptide (TPR) repeat protein